MIRVCTHGKIGFARTHHTQELQYKPLTVEETYFFLPFMQVKGVVGFVYTWLGQ